MSQPKVRLVTETDAPERRLAVRVTFTVASLGKLKPPVEGRTWVYDTRTPGLCLLLTDNGARAFYVYRKVNGKPVRVRLGGFPEITIEQARRLAVGVNAQAAAGIDPQQAKRQLVGLPTLGDLWNHYLETHAKPHKRSWRRDVEYWDRHLAALKARRLADLTLGTMARLHSTIGAECGKAAANRCLALVSAMFNKAGEMGYTGPNPCRGVKRFPELARERFIHPNEIGRFLAALDQAQPWAQDFFRLCLFTGARRGNVQRMRWADLHLERGTWEIPAAEFKTGRPMTVALSPEAVAILKARKAGAGTSPFVFPGPGKGGYIAGPWLAFHDVCAAAGLTGLRMHDLRRTLGSWQAAAGASLPVIGKSLGHVTARATTIYVRLDLDPVRQSVNAATAAMMTAASAKPEEKKGGTT